MDNNKSIYDEYMAMFKIGWIVPCSTSDEYLPIKTTIVYRSTLNLLMRYYSFYQRDSLQHLSMFTTVKLFKNAPSNSCDVCKE